MSQLGDAAHNVTAHFTADFEALHTELEHPLSVMVHGGGAADAPKRVQIRDAIDSLEIAAAFFAESATLPGIPLGAAESELFERCDATVILIEPFAERVGAQFELALHSGQRAFAEKVCVLIPPHMEEFAAGDGLWGDMVQAVPRNSRRVYSMADYEECRLVEWVLHWVEDRRQRLNQLLFDEFRDQRPPRRE